LSCRTPGKCCLRLVCDRARPAGRRHQLSGRYTHLPLAGRVPAQGTSCQTMWTSERESNHLSRGVTPAQRLARGRSRGRGRSARPANALRGRRTQLRSAVRLRLLPSLLPITTNLAPPERTRVCHRAKDGEPGHGLPMRSRARLLCRESRWRFGAFRPTSPTSGRPALPRCPPLRAGRT